MAPPDPLALLDRLDQGLPDYRALQSFLAEVTRADSDPRMTFANLGGPDTPNRARLRLLIAHFQRDDRYDELVSLADEFLATWPRLAWGAPFQAPPIPPYFVPRPEAAHHLRAALLAPPAAPGVLVVSALHGLGGVGKSTLAAALAYEPAIQSRFADGILWVTLGQQPDLLPLLSGWIQALGDSNYKPLSPDAATAHLRTLLLDKAVLLVVDDAWQIEHARHFLVGGPNCHVLVTTRDALIARALHATLHDLDLLSPEQAVALLAGRLGRPLSDAERGHAQDLARALGYLPLALELAAAQVADGVSWPELLSELATEIAHLERLEYPGVDEIIDDAERKKLSLRASFELSLRRLSPLRAARFAWFGVLPDDAVITVPMATTLWSTDLRDAADTLRYFRDKALLLPGVPTNVASQTYPTYRIHDLFHDLARARLISGAIVHHTSPISTLAHAHQALLSRYHTLTRDGLWSSLPDDGYIHARLTWHMQQAQRPDLVHALLCEETPAGRNAWFEALDAQGHLAAYVGDVVRAASLPDTEADVPLQLRCSLMITSVNSLSANIAAELLVALVEHSLLSPAAALAYCRLKPSLHQRVEALVLLAPQLSEGQQREAALAEALAAARAIRDEEERARALAGLAPQLEEGQQRGAVLAEALAAARAIGDPMYRPDALTVLAPHLPEAQRQQVLGEALAAARAIGDPVYRTHALTVLAPHLPEAQRQEVLAEALVAARLISDEVSSARTLTALVPKLSEPQREEVLAAALAAAQAIDNHWDLAEVLSSLARYLSEAEQREALAEALAEAHAISHEYARGHALAKLVPHLPEAQREEVLAEALATVRATGTETIGLEWYRAHVLTALAPHLPESLLAEALATVQAIDDHGDRTRVLAALAPHLPESLLPEALAVARAIHDVFVRVSNYVALAPHLPEAQRQQVLGEALAAARAIGDPVYRAHALTVLAPHLPEAQRQEVLAEALVAARAIGDPVYRAHALIVLAPHLPESLLAEALAVTLAINDLSGRARVLAALAPQLPEGLLAKALAVVRAIARASNRADALVALAPHLPESLLAEALAVARAIGDPVYRSHALTVLAPHLPKAQRQEVLAEALAAARAGGGEFFRARALAHVALCLPEPEQQEVLAEALAAARASDDEYFRAIALASLAPHLADGSLTVVRAEGLAAARAIGDERYRIHALAALVPHLSDAQRSEVLPEALAEARVISHRRYRAEALATLAPRLAQLSPALGRALWRDTLPILTRRTRPELLSDLAALTPVSASLADPDDLARMADAIIDVTRWWP